MTGKPPVAYRFGEFELDVSAWQLRINGRRIRVERRPMELLVLLVERHDQLVTRHEIVERVWGKDVFVDVETGVNTLVWKLRHALRDSSDAPRFIETVAGKGYRFVAPLEPAGEKPGAPVPLPVSPRPAEQVAQPERARLWPIWTTAVLITALTLTLMAVGPGWYNALHAPVTIAVLPFDNVSGDADREYLADGLTEETIASLNQVDPEHLQAIGRASTMAYKQTRKSLSDIGRELRADYLVESSMRLEGTTVSITTNLVRSSDAVQLWSATFDRQLTNVLGVQRDLSATIAEHVRVRLSDERSGAMTRRQTAGDEAFDLYMRAGYFVDQRTPEATERAIEYLTRAIERDPNYALAWARLAEAYAVSPINGDADPAETASLAGEAATQAVRADPELAEAQTALATVNFWFTWDWAAAEAAARRAIALDENYPRAHLMLAVVLSHTHRFIEATQQIDRAVALDPLDPINAAVASEVAFRKGDMQKALRHATVAIELGPEFWIGYMGRAQAYEQLGDADAALEAATQAARFSRNNSKTLSLRGFILAKMQQSQRAREALTTLETTSRSRYVPPYATALIHAGLGDHQAALEWLDRAYKVRDVHLVFLTIDPKWKRLSTDPRFQAFLSRCGFTAAKKS